jgi:hypothetical protein
VPGPFEYGVWIFGTLCEVCVVVCASRRGVFRRYFILNLYMISSVLASVARYQALTQYGFFSPQYKYAYYYSDALLNIVLYLALSSLYAQVFSDMNVERYVRMSTLLLLVGTALFSYGVVQQSTSRLVTHFVAELSQNIYFVGLVLTYILWGAILKLRETRTQLVQLVLSLGVYFSVHAATYALVNLYPQTDSFVSPLVPFFGLILPMTWAYAFWRLPVDARLAPSRLAVIPR